jgi:predicted transcriptional regulator
MSKVTYTSTLSQDLMKEVDKYALKFKVQKKAIIETALKKYFEDQRRMEFIQSFQRANNDAEQLQIAEEGIEDYIKMLDQ